MERRREWRIPAPLATLVCIVAGALLLGALDGVCTERVGSRRRSVDSANIADCSTNDPALQRYLSQLKRYQKDSAKWDRDFSKYVASLNATLVGTDTLATAGTQAFIAVPDVGVQATLFSDESWSGYDVRSGVFLTQNAPFATASGLPVVKETVDTAVFRMCFTDTESEQLASMAAKASVGGSVFGFSASASASDSTSSSASQTSSSFVVYMSMQTQAASLGRSRVGETLALSDTALNLANNDPAGFLKAYGTHFVAAKVFGCNATLTGSYTFATSAQKSDFSASVSVGVSAFGFSVSAAASFDEAMSSASSSAQLVVSASGDFVNDIEPSDPSKLSEWAKTFTTDWPVKCRDNPTNSLIGVVVQPWSAHPQLRFTATSALLASYAGTADAGLADALAKREFLLSKLAAAIEDLVLIGDRTRATLSSAFACNGVSIRSDGALLGDLKAAFEDVKSIQSPLDDTSGSTDVLSFLLKLNGVWEKYNNLLLAATYTWDVSLSGSLAMSDGSSLDAAAERFYFPPNGPRTVSFKESFSLYDDSFSKGSRGLVFYQPDDYNLAWQSCASDESCASPRLSVGAQLLYGADGDAMDVVVAGKNFYDSAYLSSGGKKNYPYICSANLDPDYFEVHPETLNGDVSSDCSAQGINFSLYYKFCPYRWLDAPTIPVDTGVAGVDGFGVDGTYMTKGLGSILHRGGSFSASFVPTFCPLPALHTPNQMPRVPVFTITIEVTPRYYGTCED